MVPPDAGRRSSWPAAEGERREWRDLPRAVRTALEAHLGARVVEATSERGGFSPGVASRLGLSDGRRVFAKVVGYDANPDSPDIHRREANVLARLPQNAPVPRLLSTFDNGSWVALFLEEIAGATPRLPWDPTELRRVLVAVEDLVDSLTPAPFDAGAFGERYRATFTLWQQFASARERDSTAVVDLDPWAVEHLDDLVELERRFPRATRGRTLLHFDLRADNILLTPDRVYFADWPWASVGAGWVDLVGFLPSVAMQGGPPPWSIFDGNPLAQGVRDEDVEALLAGFAGYLLGNARRPPPPGLSTLRPFQLAQGVEALEWLKHRLGNR